MAEDTRPLMSDESDKTKVKVDHFNYNYIGISQAVIYLISVILSLIVVIEVGETVQNFNYRCPLYSQVVWDNKVFYPTNESWCNLVIYAGIALGIAYSAFMCVFSVLLAIPITWRRFKGVGKLMATRSNFMIRGLNPVFTVFNLIVLAMFITVAFLISVGLGFLCNELLVSLHESEELAYSPKGDFINISSCSDTQAIDWSKFSIIGGNDRILDGSTFFRRLTIASIAAWLLVAVWIVLIFINCGMCFSNCSCEIAEEKRVPDKALVIAQRRSRMATPIGTPGHMTPVGLGRAPLPSFGSTIYSGAPYTPTGPPPGAYQSPMSSGYQGPPPQPMGPPPQRMGGPPMGMGYPPRGYPPMGGPRPRMGGPPPSMAGQPYMGGPPPLGMPQYMGPGGPMRPPPPRGYYPPPQPQMQIRGLPPRVSESDL